mgnify:CR=1 FL=1
MPEVQVKLRGWQVAVAAVVLAGVVAVRLVTFNDKKDDRALVQNIEMQLMSEYYPDEAARLRAAYESGDVEATRKALDSAVSTMCNIDSIRASYPLFDFSTPKDVVVKVTYSLIDMNRAETVLRKVVVVCGSFSRLAFIFLIATAASLVLTRLMPCF